MIFKCQIKNRKAVSICFKNIDRILTFFGVLSRNTKSFGYSNSSNFHDFLIKNFPVNNRPVLDFCFVGINGID